MTHPKSFAKNGRRRTTGPTADEIPGDLIEPHAQLRDQHGKLLAGIVRRDGEWVLGMDGRIAGSSAEAAQVFALIRRAAVLHEAEGTPVRLTWSDELKGEVDQEMSRQGTTLERFERQLQQSIDRQAG